MKTKRTVTIILEDEEIELALDIFHQGHKHWSDAWHRGNAHDVFVIKLINQVNGQDNANSNQ